MQDIQKIEKATKIVAQIKSLDQQIQQLDAACQELSDGLQNTVCSVTIDYSPNAKPQDESVQFDEDGSIVLPEVSQMDFYRKMMGFPHRFFETSNLDAEKKNKSKKSITVNTGDTNAIRILNIIIQAKQLRRANLINQLLKLGFDIS